MFESISPKCKPTSYILLCAIGVVVFIMILTHLMGRMLDKKIGDIRVNVPRIKVQPPNVVIRMGSNGVPVAANELDTAKTVTSKTRKSKESFLSVVFDDDEKEKQLQEPDNLLDELTGAPVVINAKTPPTTTKVKLGCTKNADCNVVNGDGKNICQIDGTCNCIGGGSGLFCHYGPVNYKDPKDMNVGELRRFKSKYRENMTLQDYKNWLLLYKKDPQNLSLAHQTNLKVLLDGGQITAKDVPALAVRAPTNASDYFQKMYKDGNIAVSLDNNQLGPFVGSNYGEYNSFVPPENTGSNWITGITNAYKTGKDDARAVDWYVRPPVTVGEDEQRVGDIYQQMIQQQQYNADIRGYLGEPNDAVVIPRYEIALQTFESGDPNAVVE